MPHVVLNKYLPSYSDLLHRRNRYILFLSFVVDGNSAFYEIAPDGEKIIRPTADGDSARLRGAQMS